MQMIDLVSAGTVELLTDINGRIWVNVDGVCALRIQRIEHISTELRSADNRVDGKARSKATQSIQAEYPKANVS